MAKGIHKGTELNNVSETWERNERNRDSEQTRNDEPAVHGDLQQVVREEASEYDETHNADHVMPGERASVRDEEDGGKD